MVLGARPADVLRLVAKDTGRLATFGVAIGLVLALLIGRALKSVVFGVDPGDPRLLAGTILFLVAATAAASYLPSRRAMRIAPVTALRDGSRVGARFVPGPECGSGSVRPASRMRASP